MIMAPIDGREFSSARCGKRKSSAVCQFSQLLRLVAIVTLAGLFLTIALAPVPAKAEFYAATLHLCADRGQQADVTA